MAQANMRLAITLISSAVLVSGLSGCATVATNTSPGSQLMAMSQAAGVRIHPEEVFTMARGDESVTTAPIAGWEVIPATALRDGVDFGFAHFSTSEPRVPAGYYKMRALANVSGVGTTEARVQLIDRSGRVVTELPAILEVHSMTVPEGAASTRSFVTAVTAQGRQYLWYRCSNGTCIRVLMLTARTLLQERQG